MVYKIIHSPIAKRSFQQNIAYLEKEWTEKEIKNFISKTSEVVSILKITPHVFPEWEFNAKIRRVVLLKQISLFYEIGDKEVFIHLFWNNYQDPEKIKSLLSS